MKGKAVVLLSGGLDSATVLGIAQDEGYACHTLSFDYGQRHRAELLAAQPARAAVALLRVAGPAIVAVLVVAGSAVAWLAAITLAAIALRLAAIALTLIALALICWPAGIALPGVAAIAAVILSA